MDDLWFVLVQHRSPVHDQGGMQMQEALGLRQWARGLRHLTRPKRVRQPGLRPERQLVLRSTQELRGEPERDNASRTGGIQPG